MARKDSDDFSTRRIKNILFLEMQGIVKNKGIFVLGATNMPQNLDKALLRRFDRLIYVPLPNKSGRLKMFRQNLAGEQFTETNFEDLALKTKEYLHNINIGCCMQVLN